MTPVVGLGLLSALCFGLADFFGGLLSRRSHSVTVSLIAHLTGIALLAMVAPFVPATGVTTAAWLWGAISGIGTGLGAAALFRAMSVGRFSLTVPLSIVASVALPVLVGAFLLREDISLLAWVGIGLAALGLWLLTACGRRSGTGDGSAGVLLALSSGVAFALQFIGLTQAGADAGLWPVLANRIVAVLVVAPMFFALGLARDSGDQGAGLRDHRHGGRLEHRYRHLHSRQPGRRHGCRRRIDLALPRHPRPPWAHRSQGTPQPSAVRRSGARGNSCRPHIVLVATSGHGLSVRIAQLAPDAQTFAQGHSSAPR